MKKLLLLLLLTSPLIGQEKNEEQNKKIAPPKEKVSMAITSSLLGNNYLVGSTGLSSTLNLEMYTKVPNPKMYFLISWIVSFSAIDSSQLGVYSGTSIYFHLGFGHWLYEKLDESHKGWRISAGYALRGGFYSSINSYLPNSLSTKGWFFSVGGTVNLRAIYQLNPNFAWVIGADFTYEFLPTSSTKSAVTGGATFGIAF